MEFVVNGNPEPENRVEKPETYWKSVLTDEVFKITRNHGTEPPYSGLSCEAFESGIYSCSCCNQQLFDSTINGLCDTLIILYFLCNLKIAFLFLYINRVLPIVPWQIGI